MDKQMPERFEERQAMVDRQIVGRGVMDERVIQSMLEVPRHVFVAEDQLKYAYEDCPLPIGAGQTISQPYIVALMIEALELEPQHRVLEIGTGSGYAAAVLSRMVNEVYTIENIEELSGKARDALDRLGYSNIHLAVGDGTLGWAAAAPFDAILVSAGAPQIPEALVRQLAIGGRLVIPVGDMTNQTLLRITRVTETEMARENLGGVRFVPLIGEEGWR